jgi:hypothetical protein
MADGAWAAAPAALLSGLPSTLHALLRRRHLLDAAAAAGALVAPAEVRPTRLVLYAVPVHAAISLFWSLVLARLLPARRTVALSVAGGGVVAALDLGLIGRRLPAIRRLPQGPQVLDHLLFGALVGVVVARRRAQVAAGPSVTLRPRRAWAGRRRRVLR